MKKILLTLLVFLSFCLPALAEEPITTTSTVESTTSSGEYFVIELELGTQSPWTKNVPINIKFRSNVDAEKVEIAWNFPDSITITKKHPQFISVKKGETYFYTATIKPEVEGTFNIAGNVIVWETKTNYVSSSYMTVVFDSELITTPRTGGYESAVLIKSGIIFLLSILAVFGLFIGAKLAFSRLKEWLKPPE